MSASIEFFDETADVGSQIINRLAKSGATSDVKEYLQLVARIYEVLAQIHDTVAEATINAGFATSMNEAERSLRGIQAGGLKNALQTQNLCQELRRLGGTIRPLEGTAQLSGGEKKVWDEFLDSLEGGESQTAQLYDAKLYEVTCLPSTVPSLDSLKENLEAITVQLVNQKARFDLLAKKAGALCSRL
jgi:hypothetical protein